MQNNPKLLSCIKNILDWETSGLESSTCYLKRWCESRMFEA